MIGLIILFSVIVIALAYGAYLNHRQTKESHAKEIEEYEKFVDLLRDEHDKNIDRLRDEYRALEQGRDEETECYQQDMLDLYDRISGLESANSTLQEMITTFINAPVGTDLREVFKNYTP